MANSYFQFKQFTIHQDRCAMKVTTDGCLFGAFVSGEVASYETKAKRVLDIGTGTGLLSLMLAQQNQFPVDAIEIDKDTFEQASQNAAASKWTDRVKIYHGDAKDFKFPCKYDVIISNPPFYENELKGENPKKNMAHHNESLHLGELLSIIKKNLAPGGSFYLLLPYKRNEEIKRLFTEKELAIWQVILVKQSVLHDYFRIIVKGKSDAGNQSEISIDEIAIKNESNQYTTSFINLLKDYYLHL